MRLHVVPTVHPTLPALLGALLLSSPGAQGAASQVRWADLEPAVRRTVGVRCEGEALMPDAADLPRKVLPKGVSPKAGRAIVEAVGESMYHLGLYHEEAQSAASAALRSGGCDAASAAYRDAILRSPAASRILRGLAIDSLAKVGISCTDCIPTDVPPRAIVLAELLPFAARATYIGTDDLVPNSPRAHFHICSTGLVDSPATDVPLATAALAAMTAFVAAEDRTALGLMSAHATAARDATSGASPAEHSKAATEHYRKALLGDPGFLALLRPRLAAEVRLAGMECSDCTAGGGRP